MKVMHTFYWTLITDLQVQLFRLFSFGLVPPETSPLLL